MPAERQGVVATEGQEAAAASAIGRPAPRRPAPADESQKVRVPVDMSVADPDTDDQSNEDVAIRLPAASFQAPTRLGRDPKIQEAIARAVGEAKARAAADGAPTPAPFEPEPEMFDIPIDTMPLSMPQRRSRTPLIIGVMVLACLVAFLVGVLVLRQQAAPPSGATPSAPQPAP